MRLIDADEIRIKPEYMHDICGVAMIRVEDIARIINDMPTIQSEPERKKGKWIDSRDVSWMCSECGKWLDVLQGDVDMNFCPNCGAKMEEEEE